MPFGIKPTCARCKSNQSTIWKKVGDGEVICNSCAGKKANGNGGDVKSDSDNSKSSSKSNNTSGIHNINFGPVRKSARLKPTKYKGQYNPKALATKGKNRRVIFKKNGLYWQIGDIVSLVDSEDNKVYYAQVRGYLQDQYCQKSAVITWLLPTLESSQEAFDPSTYILGPEEELPRPMDLFEFVCHAPSDYYKSRFSPFPTKPQTPELAYISTTLGPEIRRVPDREEIFGLKDTEAKVVVTKGTGRGKGRGGRKGSVKAEKVQAQPEIKVEIKEEVV